MKINPAVAAGAWVTEIPGLPGLRLKVRPAGNVDAQRLYRAHVNGVPRAKRIQGLDPVDEKAASDEVLIGAILLDWDGLVDDAEKPIPFSEVMARQLLTEPEYEAFREGVVWASVYVKDVGQISLKDAVGN